MWCKGKNNENKNKTRGEYKKVCVFNWARHAAILCDTLFIFLLAAAILSQRNAGDYTATAFWIWRPGITTVHYGLSSLFLWRYERDDSTGDPPKPPKPAKPPKPTDCLWPSANSNWTEAADKTKIAAKRRRRRRSNNSNSER